MMANGNISFIDMQCDIYGSVQDNGLLLLDF